MRKNTSVALDIVTKKLPNEFLTPSKKLGSGSKPTPYPDLNVLQSIQMMLILLLDPELRGGIYSLMEPKSYLLLPTLKKKRYPDLRFLHIFKLYFFNIYIPTTCTRSSLQEQGRAE